MPPLSNQKPVVAWNIYDHYPLHWGAALTVAAVTAALRSCEYGDRRSWVDLLTELVEADPHAHGVLKKLYSAIGNAEWELVPAEAETEVEQKNAAIVARDTERVIKNIPNWRAHVYGMLYGHFHGNSCREVMWRSGSDGWSIRELRMVHSRRIHYDDFFRAYVSHGDTTTPELYLADYPGKFLFFQPSVTADYPTREGLGRVLVYWLAFKRFIVRDMLGYAERFGKPFPIATWKTGDTPRAATENEIAAAKELVKFVGRGSQPGAALPDSITFELTGPGGTTNSGGSGENTIHKAIIDLCNAEISKAVVTGTLTTEVGATGGNRSLGERQGDDQNAVISALAAQFDDCVSRDLVAWIVRLNFGDDAAAKYMPRYHTKVEAKEDFKAASEVLRNLIEAGLEIAAAEVRERFGWRKPAEGEETLSKPSAPAIPQTIPAPAPIQEEPADDDESPDDDDEE